jgi:hypothetical protein
MDDLSLYPLRKTRDVRSAMTHALASYVAGLEFALPRTSTPFKFAAVYDSWAEFHDRAMSAGGKLPAAAILPDRLTHVGSSTAPRMLEWSWSGGDPAACSSGGRLLYPHGDGSGNGFALFARDEVQANFVLLVRGRTIAQRKAIVSVLEDSFVEDSSEADPSAVHPLTVDRSLLGQPIREGRLLTLSSYYDLPARFSLRAETILDSEMSAEENRWLVQIELLGEAMVAGPPKRVSSMKPRVDLLVGGVVERRGGA